MSDYRRSFAPGGMVFLTVVTYSRRPILTTDNGRSILRAAIQKIRTNRPFTLFATVLLPDHWNPRKHQFVKRVRDWQWSSFHRFVEKGHYDINWGGTEPETLKSRQDWGES